MLGFYSTLSRSADTCLRKAAAAFLAAHRQQERT
jgi:hypothetical protein